MIITLSLTKLLNCSYGWLQSSNCAPPSAMMELLLHGHVTLENLHMHELSHGAECNTTNIFRVSYIL